MPHQRVVPSPGLVVCGQHIPFGTDVGVYGPVLHHRAEIFGDDVDTFRPERWLGDEEKVRKMKNSLFTFSSGKYNCLGKNIARMEVAKLVPSVMRAFEVSWRSHYPIPMVKGLPCIDYRPQVRLANPEEDWTLMQGAFAIPVDFLVRLNEIRS